MNPSVSGYPQICLVFTSSPKYSWMIYIPMNIHIHPSIHAYHQIFHDFPQTVDLNPHTSPAIQKAPQDASMNQDSNANVHGPKMYHDTNPFVVSNFNHIDD